MASFDQNPQVYIEKFPEAFQFISAAVRLEGLSLEKLCGIIFAFFQRIDSSIRVRVYVCNVHSLHDDVYFGYRCSNMPEAFAREFDATSPLEAIAGRRFPIARIYVPYDGDPFALKRTKILRYERVKHLIKSSHSIEESTIAETLTLQLYCSMIELEKVLETATVEVTLTDDVCLGAISFDYGKKQTFNRTVLAFIEFAIIEYIAPFFKHLLHAEIASLAPRRGVTFDTSGKKIATLKDLGHEMGIKFPCFHENKFSCLVYNEAFQPHPLENVLKMIETLGKTNRNAMIYGESGVGKEEVVRAIRSVYGESKPFQTVSCARLTGELMQHDVFGRAEDSFTPGVGGYSNQRRGLLESASGGILYLNQIESLPPAGQDILVGYVDSNTISRQGSVEKIPVNVRYISSWTGDFEITQDVVYCLQHGKRYVDRDNIPRTVRLDLYRKVAQTIIHIPRLSERSVDIPVLLAYLIRRFFHDPQNRILERPVFSTQDALVALCKYNWHESDVAELDSFITNVIFTHAHDHEKIVLDLNMLELKHKSVGTIDVSNLFKGQFDLIQLYPLPGGWESILTNAESVGLPYPSVVTQSLKNNKFFEAWEMANDKMKYIAGQIEAEGLKPGEISVADFVKFKETYESRFYETWDRLIPEVTPTKSGLFADNRNKKSKKRINITND